MVNLGIAPPVTDTPVGIVRGNVGDVTFVALEPAQTGFGDYFYFSDAEILSFLASGRQSATRAVGHAYLALAARFAVTEAQISTDDLSSNDTSRSSTFAKLAELQFKQADVEDIATAEADSYFEVVDPWCSTSTFVAPPAPLGLVPFGPS